jgi:homoserine O-acetyltransferase/O-succinyltransferase
VIDTDRFFVLSADCLCNVNCFRPDVVTTGPASINPLTGEAYGPDFPPVTFHDMVRVQLGLLDDLGITTLHAAMGLSMGGCHSLELASSFPQRVRKIIPIACGASADAWLIAWIHVCLSQLALDPHWSQGRYTPDRRPVAGLTAALKLVTMLGRHWTYTNGSQDEYDEIQPVGLGRGWADPMRDPARSLPALYAIEADMEQGAAARGAHMDANHFHYLLRALRAYRVGRGRKLKKSLSNIMAEVLLLHSAAEDHLFSAASVDKLIVHLMDAGIRLRVMEHRETLGHSDLALMDNPVTAQTIQDFLNH